jgi:hypothetical protein
MTAPTCSSAVSVTATSSTSPTFTWTPNCLAEGLTVEEEIIPSAGGPQPRWIIRARSPGHGTASPVGYGHVPLSMQQAVAPTALVSGHSYRVSVWDATGAEIGSRVFGP